MNSSRPRSEAGTQKRPWSARVHLQKVLGITTVSSSGLTSDPHSGLVAYLAGCVVVLLNPTKKIQSHVINTSRKTFSALAFSADGKHLVTGESGYLPCVRVWKLDGRQLAEVQNHKYGVSCVSFSCDGSFVVSVGFQHDMTVCVWDWRRGSIVATNKVSSRVSSLSFSPDARYFVTAGKRHLKFWNLDVSKQQKNSTVPLTGRAALLGDHKDTVFSGVACGRGLMASRTFCITNSAVLCRFNRNRKLEVWVQLKVAAASCLVVSEDWVFCGCAQGLVVVASPQDLQQLASLPRPHQVTPPQVSSDPQYPDTVALTFDSTSRQLTCVYSDHSVYVWEVHEVTSVSQIYCARYHSGPVWSLQEYPALQDFTEACLPVSTFFSCSYDKTIRLWHSGALDVCGEDLLQVVHLPDHTSEGIKVLSVSPDGRFLAAGDRSGNVRIFCLHFLEQVMKIEAHDSEVLCLEFSPLNIGVNLLVSGSRDRLVHVFNVDHNFHLEQTLNDHSAAVTAVKFTGEGSRVTLVTCGVDKSVYFHTVEQRETAGGVSLVRAHHVVEKVALYDMDSSSAGVAVACQDRNVRVYDVDSGKMTSSMKGSLSCEGPLFKVHLDPSGSFLATSSSEKDVSVFDYKSGQCVASLYGHSEIVTGLLFSRDGRHLISASGDSCVFMWHLDSSLTGAMKRSEAAAAGPIRRETFIVGPSTVQLPLQEDGSLAPSAPETHRGLLETPGKRLFSGAEESEPTMPRWYRKLMGQGDLSPAPPTPAPFGIVCVYSTPPSQKREETPVKGPGRRRWVKPTKPLFLHVKELPEDSDLEEDSHQNPGLDKDQGPVKRVLPPAGDLSLSNSVCDDWDVAEGRTSVSGQQEELSSDACPVESRGGAEQQDSDGDSLSQSSSVCSLDPDDEDERDSVQSHFERFDTDLRTLQPSHECHFLNPRLSISTRFLSRNKDRFRSDIRAVHQQDTTGGTTPTELRNAEAEIPEKGWSVSSNEDSNRTLVLDLDSPGL